MFVNEKTLKNLQKKYPANALQKLLKLPKDVSLDQLSSAIRSAFRKAVGDEDIWLNEIYKDHVIAYSSKDARYYKIPFSIDGADIKFDFSRKVEVVRCWKEVESK